MTNQKIDYKKLVKKAIEALDSFYGGNPNSRYVYASAVLTEKGNIYTASNYVSDTASLTLHAEQSALAHAAAHKDARIIAIACVGKEYTKGEKYCHPCGICRQLIWENSINSGIPIKVIMANLAGEFIIKEIKELVPFPWPEQK